MKRLPLCTLFIILIMTSCSDNHFQDLSQENYSQRIPEHTINPYDVTGKLHAALTEKYIENDFDITSLEEVIKQVETLANANSDFEALKTDLYQMPTTMRMLYLTDSQPGRISEIITMSSLTWRAKISLTHYYQTLLWYQNNSKTTDEIIDFIIDYEVSIIDDRDFTENDRRILLTTASITRFSYGMQKRKVKRRDRDWELSIGNFLTAPASGNTAEAITMSVVAGIMTNQ